MIGWIGLKEGSLRAQIVEEKIGPVTEFSNIDEVFKNPPKELKALILAESEYSRVYKKLPYFSESTRMAGFADGFYKEGDRLVPYCSYLNLLQKKFADLSSFIDNSRAVLIVGDYEPARAAAVALFKIGFRHFYVLGENSNSLINENLRKQLFGLKVTPIEIRDLVSLSGETSVVIHGISKKDQVLGEWELSYLNFLSRPGLLVDFLKDGFLAQVLLETQDSELALIDGTDLENQSIDWWKSKT